MSIGFYVGIKGYVDSDREYEYVISNINDALSRNNIPAYSEPNIDSNKFYIPIEGNKWGATTFGRCNLDGGFMSKFSFLAELGIVENDIDLPFLGYFNSLDGLGYFLPQEFSSPIMIEQYSEASGEHFPCVLISSFALNRELKNIAPLIGITIANDDITEEQAHIINESIVEDYPAEIFLNDRSAYTDSLRSHWLVLYEATRLSVENKTAMVFE